VRNAFNCLDREAMLAQAALRTPHLMPWLQNLYGSPLPLLVKGTQQRRVIWSKCGPQQGCPFGTLLFALGIHPVIQQLRGLWLNVWYADDGLLMGPTRAVEAALLHLQTSFADIGLELNMSKCVTWGPGLALPTNSALTLQNTACVPWAQGSGIVVLGSPVTYPDTQHSFMRTFWAAKVAEVRALLRKISAIGHAQIQHALIRACADVTRVNHLLRSTSTSGLDSQLLTMQDHLVEAVETIMGRCLQDDQRTQVFLPIRLSGMGVGNPLSFRPSARVTAVASFLRDFLWKHDWIPQPLLDRVPPDFSAHLRTLLDTLGAEVQPLHDWHRDPRTVLHSGPRPLAQQTWNDKVDALRHRAWLQTGTQRDMCRKALQTTNSGAWLGSLPSAHFNTLIEHCDYRILLQWWLGMSLVSVDAGNSTCAQCGSALDAWGDHAVSCARNGITTRHGAIQDWLITTARSAGVQCSREEGLEDRSRPGDVLLHHWAGRGPLAVDVTCVNPLRPSTTCPTPELVRTFLSAEEKRKRTKYADKCAEAGWGFLPLVMHPFAGVTPEGGQFLHRLSRLYAENSVIRPTKTERIRHFWESFTSTVVRQVAAQLRLTTYVGPQGPALPQLRPLDLAGNELPRCWTRAGQREQPPLSGPPAFTLHQPYR
jgi:hypothetical protein